MCLCCNRVVAFGCCVCDCLCCLSLWWCVGVWVFVVLCCGVCCCVVCCVGVVCLFCFGVCIVVVVVCVV